MACVIDAWRAEHRDFNRLLRMLQDQMDLFAAGETPNYQLMLDIICYLRDYPDQHHHPREDEALRRLALRCPDRELPIARLMQEHRVIAHAGETLRTLLEQVLDGAIVRRAEIEIAAATYLVYYGNHIAREEEDILPRALEALTPADWRAVGDAAPEAHDPLFGPRPQQHLAQLRRRIAAEVD